MTNEFLRMLEILRFSTFGTKSECVTNAELTDVCNVAVKQGVFPLVYGAMTKEEQSILGAKGQQMFFQGMVKNEQKMVALSGILKKLENAGVEYCILKGGTVAVEYHLSECRLSGDIDLYINPDEEERVSKLLKDMGMEVESRAEGKQDFKASSPLSGLIEVHVMLYAKTFGEYVLKNKFGVTEPFREVQVSDFLTVKALGIHDTLNFLTAHLLKHFVREGCGIRQVTDLLAFVNRHKNEIDFSRFFADLEALKFKKLILNVFGIGVKYFGMELDEYSLENIDELLNDFEVGENFGYGEAERQGFYEQFVKNRVNVNEEVRADILGRKRRSVLKAVFLPSKKYLVNKGFGYLEKTPILYPVAYVHRLCNLLKSMITGKRKYKNAMGFAETDNAVIRQRIEMMKKLDIVD